MNLSNLRKVQIKKRSVTRWIALAILFLPFVFSFLTEFLGLPRVIRFSIDFLIIVLITIVAFNAILNRKFAVSRITSVLSILVIVFAFYTLVSYLFNYQSVFYYIWGFRNNFRFFAAFFLFIAFLNVEDIEDSFKALDVLFWIHVILTLIQFFIFKYEQDFLGGIFGVVKGCNGYGMIFLTIIVTIALLSFMNGTSKAIPCFFKCGASFLVAALSELKFFFFVFVAILVICSLITAFSTKKLLFMLGISVIVMIACTILVALFEYFENFFSIEFLLNSLSQQGYASDEDMGRVTAIPYICEHFLTTFQEQLFGMGLGNCDTSTISIFNTSFYDTYVDTHYSIFSVAFMFIETGFIGLLFYISFFIICLGYFIVWFRNNKGNRFYNQIGIVIAIVSLVILFYNSSLRTEAGYMVYFVLALPFIGVANEETPLLK